eukprot:scaffold23625_cov137-Cylindrotheca_fusiformis.AAC.1
MIVCAHDDDGHIPEECRPSSVSAFTVSILFQIVRLRQDKIGLWDCNGGLRNVYVRFFWGGLDPCLRAYIGTSTYARL